jgi:hypothetical protein
VTNTDSHHAWVAAAGITALFGWLFAYPPLHHGYLAESDLYEFFLPTFLAPITQWSSFEFAGTPAFADPGDTSMYPIQLVARAFGSWYLVFVGAYVLAAMGMYAYIFSLTRSRTAALFSALAYGLSEALVERVAHLGVVQTIGWFPWIALAIDRVRGHRPWQWMALGGLFVGCSFLGGNPQVFLYGGYVFGLYAVIGAITERPQPAAYLATAGMAVLGMLLAAVKLVPTLETSAYTARQLVGFGGFVGHANTPAQMLSIVFPTIVHEGREAPTYVGIATLIFAIHASRSLFRDWRVGFWTVMVCLALLLGVGAATPLARLVYAVPFYDTFRVVGRHLIFAAFGFATLAGLGVHAATRRDASFRPFGISGAVVGFAIVAALAIFVRWPNAFEFDQRHLRLPLHARPLDDGVLVQLIVALAAVAASAAFVRARGSFASSMLVIALTVDLVHALPYDLTWSGLETPFVPVESALNPSVHAAALAKDLDGGRRRLLAAAGSQIDAVAPGVFARVWRIPNAGGYGPMLLSRYARLMEMAPNGSIEPSVLGADDRALNVAAVKYVLVHPDDFTSPKTFMRDGLTWKSDPLELFVGSSECGEDVPRKLSFGVPATIEVARVAIVAHLECAESVPEDTPVVGLSVGEPDDPTSRCEWRAGREIAEGRLTDSEVRQRAKHGPARVFDEIDGKFTYHADVDLKTSQPGARIELTLYRGIGRMILDRVTAVDDAGVSHPLSVADLLLSEPRRWRFAGEFVTSRVSDRPGSVGEIGERYHVFENRRARPRAWLAREVIPLDDAATEKAIHASSLPDGRSFDDERMALVPSGAVAGRQYADAPAAVTVTSIRDGEFNIVVSSGGGFLVLSEAFYPGWHAQVDGRDVAVIRADGALQGIEVPAGGHRVRFVFAARTLRAARAMTVMSLVVVGVILSRARRRAPSKTK